MCNLEVFSNSQENNGLKWGIHFIHYTYFSVEYMLIVTRHQVNSLYFSPHQFLI